jgi:cytosolic 5'-nucleotidase 3
MKNIHIKNKKDLLEKIRKMRDNGSEKLHVVSDFDGTLTKSYYKGKKIPSTFAVIREGNYLGEEYSKKTFEMYDKYRPIEINHDLPYKYRYKKMKEWWETHEKILVKHSMNKKIIDNILTKYPNLLRKNTDELFKTLEKNNVPLLIFSSGLGNFIEGHLQQKGLLTKNVQVISNNLKFDKTGRAVGYKEPVIHMMNKSEKKLNKKYKEKIKNKTNIILLGDSIDDKGMIQDIKAENVITIGFLNNKPESLKKYEQEYDVVILNDGSMNYVNNIIKKILQK